MRQGIVYFNNVEAGIITETDDKSFRFEYLAKYLAHPDAQPVSLTLPLKNVPYESDVLFPFFSNMLSEGENREIQSRLLKIDPEDDFGIMLATAGCDTAGAVTVKPMSHE